MTDETDTPKVDKNAEGREAFRREAAHILMQHFSAHQDSVLVVSIGQQGIMAACSPVANLSAALLMREFAKRTMNQCVDDAVIKMRQADEAKPKETPPEPSAEEQPK